MASSAEKRTEELAKRAEVLRAEGKPYVLNVELKEARDWFQKYHYTGSIGASQTGRFGYYTPDGKLWGIVAVGNATNVAGLSKKFEMHDWLGNVEISRVAMLPEAQDRVPCSKCEGGEDPKCRKCGGVGTVPKLSTSVVIKAALDVLGDQGYEWCFSYADTGQGHHGGIYQSVGAIYTGRSPGVPLYVLDGKRFHNRNAMVRWRSNSFPHKPGERCPGKACKAKRCVGRLAAMDGHDLQKDWKGTSDKHTYILICAKSKKDRALLRKHLEQFALPYPKRDGVGDVTESKDTVVDKNASTGYTGQAVASRENTPASSGESPGQNRGTAPPQHLYAYQRTGAAFLATAGSALMADEMGTGKTPTSIRALQLMKAQGKDIFPAIIVCPNGVKRTWRIKLEQWFPDARVTVAGSGIKKATEAAEEILEGIADILVVNYEILPKLSRLAAYGSVRIERCTNCDPTSTRKPALCQWEPKVLNGIPFRSIIADEAHRVKEPRTQWARALWSIGDQADHRFGLTGTPTANRPSDLWAVMRYVAPEDFAARTPWVNRYLVTELNIHSGFPEPVGFKPEMRAEFDKYFLPRFIRRTKAQVLPDLPPKTYQRRDIVLGQKQKKAYNQFRDTLVAQVDNGAIFATNPLHEVMRLRQLASAYGEATVKPDGSVGYMLAEPSTKLDEIIKKNGPGWAPGDLLEDLGDRQAVVFAESAQLIRMLANRFEDANARAEKSGKDIPFPFGLIIGGQSDQERESACERFEQGDYRYMLATVGAGGEGIDGLQVADTAIFLQRPWSAVQSKQAEDRLHRAGQKGDTVTIVDLVTEDSVEDRVLDSLIRKAGALEDLCRDKDALKEWLG